jgi:hypothetical protein
VRQFIDVGSQDEHIACNACRHRFLLPPLNESRTSELRVSYRLDGLMARGMDQDVLPPLLALRWALRFVASPPLGAFWPGLELVHAGTVVAEVDVVVSDRSRLLFIEAKHNAGSVDLRQLHRLVDVAQIASAAVVVAAATGNYADTVAEFAERNAVQLVEQAELAA